MAKPIIPWIGSKRRLAKHILPLFPEHTCYVEPFCGAAALFFGKPPAKCEVLNDINGELCNLYRVVQNHKDELLRYLHWVLVSRQDFERWTRTPPEVLTDVQRAARFFFMQKCAFGGLVARQHFGTDTTHGAKLSAARIEADLEQARRRLDGVYVENMGWEQCVSRYDRPHTLFYMDPPYWGTEGYGVDFGFEQYSRMAGLARSIAGKMIISVNDIPEMREAFAGLQMRQVDIRYQVGGLAQASKKGELIICNWA